MNLIISTLLELLPPKRKLTPSGWTSFDAVCCHNRGETRDTKKRGGLLINNDNQFQYHCFNCGFKAGWSEGKLLSANTRKLFTWLGLTSDRLDQLNFEALRNKDTVITKVKTTNPDLKLRELPSNTLSIQQWLSKDLNQEQMESLANVITYLDQRGMDLTWYPWHWSEEQGYRDRVIIPFYDQVGLVGYTARKITEGKPKYITDSQTGYVFNLYNQPEDRKFVIVVEGQFDAIGIDGVAIMTNEANQSQINKIAALNREIIIVPDRDRAGSKMIKTATDNSWSVSLPPWDKSCKDVADAVKLYGRLYTLRSILHYKESNPLKIQLLTKTKFTEYAEN